MGMFAVAPDGFVSRAQEDQEQEIGIALDVDTLATAMANVTDDIHRMAEADNWRCVLTKTQLESLKQDMATMCARLEALREGRV
jgi:hypothetical protein